MKSMWKFESSSFSNSAGVIRRLSYVSGFGISSASFEYESTSAFPSWFAAACASASVTAIFTPSVIKAMFLSVHITYKLFYFSTNTTFEIVL